MKASTASDALLCSSRSKSWRIAWRPDNHLIANVKSPAASLAQVAQPAGELPEEMGTNALPVTPSTATECALLPLASCVTRVRVPASMMDRTGVQGEAALQAPPGPALPDAVQRLPAL